MRLCLGTAKGIVTLNPDRRGAPLMVLANPASIWCMAQDSGQPEVIYAGSSQNTHIGSSAASGTLSKSIDGGRSWSDITPRGARDEDIWAIATSPTTAGLLLIGTSRARLFKSLDGGRTFDEVRGTTDHIRRGRRSLMPEAGVFSIYFDPWSEQTIYAALQGVLLRSADGGSQFHPLASRLPAEIHAVAAAAPRILLAATAFGLFASPNGGVRWQPAGYGISRPYLLPLLMPTANGGPLFTAGAAGPPPSWHCAETGADALIFRSLDHGNTFQTVDTAGSLRGMVMRIAHHPDDPSRAFAVTSSGLVLALLDFGEQVIEVATKLPPIHDFAILP